MNLGSDVLNLLVCVVITLFLMQGVVNIFYDFPDWLKERRRNREIEQRVGLKILAWNALWNLYRKLEAANENLPRPQACIAAYEVDKAVERVRSLCGIDTRKSILLFIDELKRTGVKNPEKNFSLVYSKHRHLLAADHVAFAECRRAFLQPPESFLEQVRITDGAQVSHLPG
jgi:hypothetical protein